MSPLISVAIECSEFDEPIVAALSDAFGGLHKLHVPDPYIMYIGLVDQTLFDLSSAINQFENARWLEPNHAKLTTVNGHSISVVLGHVHNPYHAFA